MNLESLLADIIALNQSTPRLRSALEALGHIRLLEHHLVCLSGYPEGENSKKMRHVAMNLAAESIRLVAFLVAFLDSLKDDSPRDTIPAPPELP